MSLNYALILGYVLGLLYSIANKEYPFGLSTAEGKQNIFKSFVAFLIVMVIWYFAFFIHYDDNIDTNELTGVMKYATVGVIYFFTGFCIEFVIKAMTKMFKQYVSVKTKTDIINDNKPTTPTQS